MSFFKFLFSKAFLIQLGLAILALVIVAFLALQWLEYSTNQDQRIEVPDLSRLSLDVVEDRLAELDLRYEILDSANFNPDYPRYAVIEQVPQPGKHVKENRKIYLTLNPSGYRKVAVPDLVRRTRRQVEPTLRSLGFEIGDITEKPDIGTDVLELRHKGRLIEPGDELMKTSVIDLVVGDGSGRYRGEDEEEEDTFIENDEFESDINDEF
ncbi:PASTA domain-containing protein [Antarcticibacterium flavum]|uniref:PASTA domain-containing protein n=1 Tax=Antarcticibacterium flavum TaxID=2058175 RepID=A0A5B7X4V4_9FLAO|nr:MULTISPECIES: PASTA domain-containing protein [Antarcticibacterium]MCM4159992.1 serine/threonine protein kinase [Antarcticibacterium sp. W02-3]QCY70417.1 PASTA domain-containing protein [Antarcticibacterium flavum]